jgi:hypothetical protein
MKQEHHHEIQSSTLPEPVTREALQLRARMSHKRWERIVRDALEKVRVVNEIENEQHHSGDSRRKCHGRVAPEVTWSRYLHWWRRWKLGEGLEWERLLDRRVPPAPAATPEDIQTAAVALRRAAPNIDCSTAGKHLMDQFGKRGKLSESTLRRIWSAAGLTHPGQGDACRFEKVETFYGGGALALIDAAALETGIMEVMAHTAIETGKVTASAQEEPVLAVKPEGRDERGCFTADYNRSLRAGIKPGQEDFRWNSDTWKRERRELSTLALLRVKPQTLAKRFLTLGLIPLITERRGFDGLDGPKSQWLEVLGQSAYQPATLDKTLAELALLDAGDTLWATHGQQWGKRALEWSKGEASWKQFVVYVDITTDPYWTQRYASSGKVTRLGRVMPCLSRVAVTGGPGVPLLVETTAGTVSLKKALTGVLAAVEDAAGLGEIRRVTVVDAEAATAGLLTALSEITHHDFITVLKGPGARGVTLEEPGDWAPYRTRDRVRSGKVTLQGKDAPEGGLVLYAVEMIREGGRHPHPTLFITTASPEKLSPAEVADTYLSRWPHQEQVFRNSRNGAGLEHSHGYGGECVTHVAIETELEKAARRVGRAEKRVEKNKTVKSNAQTLLSCAETPSQKTAARQAVKQADKESRTAEKNLKAASKEYEELKTVPRLIYTRDTTRENIVTVFSLSVMLLIEFVLREYFGKIKMELRTFIEYFLYAPTKVRTSAHRIVYQLEANPRNLKRTEQLRRACQEVTRRELRKDGKLVVFEVVDPPG